MEAINLFEDGSIYGLLEKITKYLAEVCLQKTPIHETTSHPFLLCYAGRDFGRILLKQPRTICYLNGAIKHEITNCRHS